MFLHKKLEWCLTDCLSYWSINADWIVLVVSDNGTNVVKAAKIVQEKYLKDLEVVEETSYESKKVKKKIMMKMAWKFKTRMRWKFWNKLDSLFHIDMSWLGRTKLYPNLALIAQIYWQHQLLKLTSKERRKQVKPCRAKQKQVGRFIVIKMVWTCQREDRSLRNCNKILQYIFIHILTN